MAPKTKTLNPAIAKKTPPPQSPPTSNPKKQDGTSVSSLTALVTHLDSLCKEVHYEWWSDWNGDLNDPALQEMVENPSDFCDDAPRFSECVRGLRELVRAVEEAPGSAANASIPIPCAVWRAKDTEDILRRLLAAGVTPAHTPGILVKVLYEGDASFSKIKLLIQAGADVNGKDDKGKTALMVCHDDLRVLHYLLDACGADIRAADAQGKTVLMHHLGDLEKFQDYGLLTFRDLDARDNQGRNLLLCAADRGYGSRSGLSETIMDIVNFVRWRGLSREEMKAFFWATDSKGRNFLQIMVENGTLGKFLPGQAAGYIVTANTIDEIDRTIDMLVDRMKERALAGKSVDHEAKALHELAVFRQKKRGVLVS